MKQGWESRNHPKGFFSPGHADFLPFSQGQIPEDMVDDPVRSRQSGGCAKTSRVRRTGVVRRSDKGEAHRRRWTFYEAIIL
jgi:hypothetical protein